MRRTAHSVRRAACCSRRFCTVGPLLPPPVAPPSRGGRTRRSKHSCPRHSCPRHVPPTRINQLPMSAPPRCWPRPHSPAKAAVLPRRPPLPPAMLDWKVDGGPEPRSKHMKPCTAGCPIPVDIARDLRTLHHPNLTRDVSSELFSCAPAPSHLIETPPNLVLFILAGEAMQAPGQAAHEPALSSFQHFRLLAS